MIELIHRLAGREELATLGPWLTDLCRSPAQQCLHTWTGESPETLIAQLNRCFDAGELVYILARDGEELVAALGCEYDLELGRGWLHGPHTTAKQWESVANSLIETLRRALPASITTLDSYLNSLNQRALNFYTRQGFEPTGGGLTHGFGLEVAEAPAATQPAAQRLAQQHATGFLELFEQVFPNSYYSGRRILSMRGQSHEVLASLEADQLTGFIVLNAEPDGPRGSIEFLGVHEQHRRRGRGRELLLSGIEWLKNQARAEHISLSVSADAIGSRRLYESVGFELEYTGQGLRLKPLADSRSSPAAPPAGPWAI